MKNIIVFTVVIVLLLIGYMFIDRRFEKYIGEKVILVGTSADFPPFEYINRNTGKIVGFDIDIMRAIAKDQGFEVEFRDQDFLSLFASVDTWNTDIAASAISITPEREKLFLFSDPYIDAGIGLMVRGDTEGFSDIEKLKGITVTALVGTSGEVEAMKLKEQGVVGVYIPSLKVPDMLDKLFSGKVDAFINDIPVNIQLEKKFPDRLLRITKPLNSERYGFLFKSVSKDLQQKVNKGLANIMKNGEYERIHGRYF